MKRLLYLIPAALIFMVSACSGSGNNELFVDLSIHAGADDSIVITWEAADTLDKDVYMYNIYISDTENGTYEKATSPYVSTGGTSLTNLSNGIEFGETYFVKLEAADYSYEALDVDDPYSDIFEVTVRNADIFPVITSCYSHKTSTYDSVFIEWDIEADPTYEEISNLEIYRKTGDGAYSLLTSPSDTADDHYDKTVVDGTAYTYKIRVTYEGDYEASTESYYESNERTVTYSDEEMPAVTIDAPTLTSIEVDTDYSGYACQVTYECAKNNTSGEFGAELRFVNSSGVSTNFTADEDNNFGNTNPVTVNISSAFLDAETYSLYTRVYVEYGGERTYSDYLYKSGIVIE